MVKPDPAEKLMKEIQEDERFAEVLKMLEALPPPPHGIHRSARIYNNDEVTENYVRPEDLITHAYYTFTMRPGTALIIDGNIVQTGYLGDERTKEHMAKIINSPYRQTEPTRYPYN